MAGSKKGIKKANRKATKGVRRLWKKGQSSSYNPTFNKFRLEAKKDAFGNKGTKMLNIFVYLSCLVFLYIRICTTLFSYIS